jgi:hypothetical protein
VAQVSAKLTPNGPEYVEISRTARRLMSGFGFPARERQWEIASPSAEMMRLAETSDVLPLKKPTSKIQRYEPRVTTR